MKLPARNWKQLGSKHSGSGSCRLLSFVKLYFVLLFHCRSAYKGYVLENRIHFRVHAALNAIDKYKAQKQNPTTSDT